MEWIVSLATLVVLLVFIILAFLKKSQKEKLPVILLFFAFFVYHIGDMGLWYECNYEVYRRIASAGFYLIMPFALLLMYVLVPKEKMNLFIRIATLVLILPWIYAFVMIGSNPLVYLHEVTPVRNANFEMILVLSFVIGTLFCAIVGYRAARFREDYGRRLAKHFSLGIVIYTLIILCLFMSEDAFGYDATWLFGVATVFFAILLLLGMECKSREAAA